MINLFTVLRKGEMGIHWVAFLKAKRNSGLEDIVRNRSPGTAVKPLNALPLRIEKLTESHGGYP